MSSPFPPPVRLTAFFYVRVLWPEPCQPTYCGIAFHPACVRMLGPILGHVPSMVPNRTGNWITLYHGTKPSLVDSIRKIGFRRAACRSKPPCPVVRIWW
jgi:hypothetical protein